MAWIKQVGTDSTGGLLRTRYGTPVFHKVRKVDQLNNYQVLKMGSFYEEFELNKQHEIR
jgi:hypothetical protein